MAANKIDSLLAAFEKAVSEPWPTNFSISERVWFLVYEPEEHRKLMLRLTEFELAVRQSGKRWEELSLAHLFPEWMAAHEYRDAYFVSPDALSDELETSFVSYATQQVNQMANENTPDENTLTVIRDAASLFGLVRLSQVIEGLQSSIVGRILILFPGSYEANHYRLLNARDGWSYLARPLTA